MAFAVLATVAVASTAYSVVSDVKGAKGAKKTSNFQAGILEQQANDTIQIGEDTANRSASAARGLTGAQTVTQAASGVDVSSGSAADVIANDKRLNAIDVQTTKNNAARDALGLRKQAQLVRMGGQAQAQSYTNQAYGSLLSGATNLASIYQAYGQRSTSPTVPRTTGPSASSGGYRSGTAQK